MTPPQTSHRGERLKRFLFAESAAETSAVDTAIILLLMAFLFCSTISIAAMNIAYGAATILWVGRMVYRRRNDIPRTPLDSYFIAFIAAEALATLFAYNKEQSLLYMYRRVTLLPVLYVMIANIRSPRLLRLLLGTFLTSVLFVALWSLRSLVLHFGDFILFQRRLQDFQMYMTAGGMMMIGMLLLLPFTVHPHTPAKVRWLALASLIPIGINLLFTFTRSSWLGFLAGAIVIGAFRSRKIFLPLAVVLIAVVMLASPEMRERMSSTFNPYHYNNITRLQMWTTGVKIFLDNPIVGVGDIGIEQVWPQYAPPDWKPAGHLHNNLIMWAVTLGGVGLVVLVALFAKIWMVVRHIEKRLHGNWFGGSLALGALAVHAGFHVNGLFEWNFGDAEIIIIVWTITAFALAADTVLKPEKTDG
jgi:O-antigen ligase